MSTAESWRVAIHEAAHAVAAVALGKRIRWATITGEYGRNAGCVQVRCPIESRADALVDIIVTLAGPMAEARHTGGEMLTSIFGADHGNPESDRHVISRTVLDWSLTDLDIGRCAHQTYQLLDEVWPTVLEVAESLVESRTLRHEDVEQIYRRTGPRRPLVLV